jgi:ubiquinone/menaquinone biosynthesis C-methylase UbiE
LIPLAAACVGVSIRCLSNVVLVKGETEDLPVESGWADLVISIRVLNPAAYKESVFSEIARNDHFLGSN